MKNFVKICTVDAVNVHRITAGPKRPISTWSRCRDDLGPWQSPAPECQRRTLWPPWGSALSISTVSGPNVTADRKLYELFCSVMYCHVYSVNIYVDVVSFSSVCSFAVNSCCLTETFLLTLTRPKNPAMRPLQVKVQRSRTLTKQFAIIKIEVLLQSALLSADGSGDLRRSQTSTPDWCQQYTPTLHIQYIYMIYIITHTSYTVHIHTHIRHISTQISRSAHTG